MPNVLADLPTGEHPLEEWLAPLFDAIKGHPDAGVAFSLTEYDDLDTYALTVRNKDTGIGRHFNVQGSDGVDRFRVRDADTTILNDLDLTGLLSVQANSADYALTVQNLETGVGRHFKILDSGGADLLRVRDGDVSVFTTFYVQDAAQFDGNLGFFGLSPVSQGSVDSSASDLASVISLANSLRTLVRRYNLA